MGIISKAADVYYTYRFIKTLTTPWEKTDAYAMGIIDKDGNPLKKSSQLRTSREKDSYTVFHRLVFNLKRIFTRLPFARSALGSYAAAMFLLKENTAMSDTQIEDALKKVFGDIDEDIVISESNMWNVIDNDELAPGAYTLRENVLSPTTGEAIAREGSRVIVSGGTEPADWILGVPVYKVRHANTKTDIYVSPGDLMR